MPTFQAQAQKQKVPRQSGRALALEEMEDDVYSGSKIPQAAEQAAVRQATQGQNPFGEGGDFNSYQEDRAADVADAGQRLADAMLPDQGHAGLDARKGQQGPREGQGGKDGDVGGDDEPPETVGDLYDDNDAAQNAEREAMEADLQRSRAEALMDLDSRAGLGGMGLSGASSSLRGDIARTQDRGAQQQMADLGRRHRDEDWQQQQREIALWDLEQSMGADLDQDGHEGPPPDMLTPEEEPDAPQTPDEIAADLEKERLTNEQKAAMYDELPRATFAGPGSTPIDSYTSAGGIKMIVYVDSSGQKFVAPDMTFGFGGDDE